MEGVRRHLSAYTDEGQVYRVDFRLRPYGRASYLVHSDSFLRSYYESSASPWEFQALLKLRPIAGDIDAGKQFLEGIQRVFERPPNSSEIVATIRSLRTKASQPNGALSQGTDVKSGVGGIRDVEFLVQGLQLLHAHKFSEILGTNTLAVLEKIESQGLIPTETTERLGADYLYLRRVEHYLQLLEDRQVHLLPTAQDQQEALARRIEGRVISANEFVEKIGETMERIHRVYDHFLTASN